MAAPIEIYSMNPYSSSISLNSTKGGKLFLRVTKDLAIDEQIRILIKNGYIVRNYLEVYRTRFTWRELLVHVLDNASVPRDIIKNYKLLTIDNVL